MFNVTKQFSQAIINVRKYNAPGRIRRKKEEKNTLDFIVKICGLFQMNKIYARRNIYGRGLGKVYKLSEE